MTAPNSQPSPSPDGDVPPYDPAAVEQKWRDRWRELGTNETDLANGERPHYALMMFPYPSAEGLHVGNLFAFTGNDIYGRFQRLQGHTVFEPLGYDAFGIHSENYALKVGEHPMRLIPRNIANFRRQLERAGLMVDWRHSLDTTDPAYYRWTQWVFLQLYQQGLAYKKKAAVNWCPSCKTVLANEQVVGGACERCGTPVEQRELEQWFFRISDYAGRLLDNLDGLDWSESTKTAQRNWIGRSEGARIAFEVRERSVERGAWSVEGGAGSGALGAGSGERGAGSREQGAGNSSVITVFTTRPDTVFGATYLVLAPEHPLVETLASDAQRAAVAEYLERTKRQGLVSRKTTGEREKTGVFTGAYATNPATNAPIPIWIADYVLMEYGTGAIMAVPGHDERDFEFATQFALPIVRVVAPTDATAAAAVGADPAGAAAVIAAYVGDGRLVNSGEFDGLVVDEGARRIVARLAEQGAAEAVVNYRLHDWCISRQRYWGPPIPIVYCDRCGTVPVPQDQLPVVLPDIEDFKPDDSGVSPLARHEEWYYTDCPSCGGARARRETDVSDTFLDSAWYFLRYPSTEYDSVPFDQMLTRKWLPVDSYIGGNEHAVLHLLYSRFITMVLHDAGHLAFEEPFTRFRAHGLIIREGAKMSKSRGNVVNPDEYIDKWGADAFRTYLMFLGPYEQGGDFQDSGISGAKRFLDRLWASVHEASAECGVRSAEQGPVSSVGAAPRGRPDQGVGAALRGRPEHDADTAVMRKLHQTIRKVTDDLPRLSYNTAIGAMMEYMNVLRAGQRAVFRAEVEPLVQLAAPFAPHVAEELWERLGHSGSVFDAGWPAFDADAAAERMIRLAVQVNGKLRGTLDVAPDITKEDALARALADPSIAKFVTGEPTKVVFVPGRLLSIVV